MHRDIPDDVYKELEERFLREILPHAAEIDPTYEKDWVGIALGWALAIGTQPHYACEFSALLNYYGKPWKDPKLR